MATIDHKKTGQRLRALRIGAGETVKDLANTLGVSQSSVVFYENGTRRPADNVKIKYADHYKKSIEFLFYGGK